MTARRGDGEETERFRGFDDVYYYIRWRLKLEGETENMGVCTKERKGVTAAVLMATPCTNSLGGERKVRFTENTAMRHRRGG